ncbi:MAG: hypothetical protein KatS3mg104_0696 [Phycisphaerae bacterium]|nr:MAG: hypothetical protein KatS3mg104_0696 [Phycisphaerae bacterium]
MTEPSLVSANYVAWGPNWKYAPVQTRIGSKLNDRWNIQGQIPDFRTQITGTILQTGSRPDLRI